MIRLHTWKFVAAGAPLTMLLVPLQAPIRQAQGWPIRQAQGWPVRQAQGSSAWSGWPWVVTIAVIAVAAVVWALLARRQRQRSRRTCHLELANLGNVRSRYELRAEDPGQALQFSFVLGGARLYGQSVTPPTAPSTSSGQAPSTSNGTFASGQAPSTSSGQAAASSLERAGRAKGWAMHTGSAVAGTLSTLGALLPRSASGPLRQVASQIRRGGGSVRRAEHLTRQAGRLRPKARPGTPPLRQASLDYARDRQGRPTRPSTGAEKVPAAARSDVTAQTWVQTPFVEAGDTLAIDLLISPTDPYQTAYYPFTVTSRSLDAPDAPLIAEEGSVHVVGLTLFQRFGPLLVALTIGMMLLFIASLFIGNGP